MSKKKANFGPVGFPVRYPRLSYISGDNVTKQPVIFSMMWQATRVTDPLHWMPEFSNSDFIKWKSLPMGDAVSGVRWNLKMSLNLLVRVLHFTSEI
jgi:hypothetical protein